MLIKSYKELLKKFNSNKEIPKEQKITLKHYKKVKEDLINNIKILKNKKQKTIKDKKLIQWLEKILQTMIQWENKWKNIEDILIKNNKLS